MGELADRVQLQNERKAKLTHLYEELKASNKRIDGLKMQSGETFARWQKINDCVRTEIEITKRIQRQIDDIYLDMSPLANREKPETNRGVSID